MPKNFISGSRSCKNDPLTRGHFKGLVHLFSNPSVDRYGQGTTEVISKLFRKLPWHHWIHHTSVLCRTEGEQREHVSKIGGFLTLTVNMTFVY